MKCLLKWQLKLQLQLLRLSILLHFRKARLSHWWFMMKHRLWKHRNLR